ncbi:MAG: hypothetical protein ABI651_07010 [Verrucomicrobiota bacterium]
MREVTRIFRFIRGPDWERFIEALPRDLSEGLARVRDGSFQVHLDHRHLDPVINRLVLGVLTAALFLIDALERERPVPHFAKPLATRRNLFHHPHA